MTSSDLLKNEASSQYKRAGSASPLIAERGSAGKARTLTPFKNIVVASVLKYAYKILPSF